MTEQGGRDGRKDGRRQSNLTPAQIEAARRLTEQARRSEQDRQRQEERQRLEQRIPRPRSNERPGVRQTGNLGPGAFGTAPRPHRPFLQQAGVGHTFTIDEARRTANFNQFYAEATGANASRPIRPTTTQTERERAAEKARKNKEEALKAFAAAEAKRKEKQRERERKAAEERERLAAAQQTTADTRVPHVS